MAKIDLVNNEWVDLIFEGRNQAYGAYKLRKGTSSRNVKSILIMLAMALHWKSRKRKLRLSRRKWKFSSPRKLLSALRVL